VDQRGLAVVEGGLEPEAPLRRRQVGVDIDIDLGGFNFWRGSLGVVFRF